MSSRRPAILMGILLALTLGYLAKPYYLRLTAPARPAIQPPLPGENSISGLKVKRNLTGAWVADFDYFFTGEPAYVVFEIEAGPTPPDAKGRRFHAQAGARARRGQNHATVVIGYPGIEGVTRNVTASMRNPSIEGQLQISQQIDQVIEWPSLHTWLREKEYAQRGPEENLRHAVALIDAGNKHGLQEAKFTLERVIRDDPKFASGYVELARVAMKSSWGTDGLHQAETLLMSAREIEPDNVNAKILLGYVYAHQRRHAKAEALFIDAARSDTRNLWLWTNWGELLEMQGKTDTAMAKYRETISRPMNHDSSDRARTYAYGRMLAVLEERQKFDDMEPLFKQQIADFGTGSCYSAGYARFLLQVRGDPQASIDLSRRALNQNCEDSESRQLLGLAHYVKWAGESGPERIESLHQARIYLPAGAMPLYLLASHTRTLSAAKALIATGERIDQQDDLKMTALAYALQKNDLATARRLLTLGARADAPVGFEEVPLALMPVMEGNVAAVRMLRKAGVKYSKLRFRGTTALQIARQTGDDTLIAALEPDETVF